MNFGGGSYVLYAEITRRRRDRGRPGALQRQLRPPRAPAAGRGQGAGRGDRPDRRAHPRGLAEPRRARRSSRRSARTRWSRACRSPHAGGDDSDVARVVSEAIAGRRLLELEYYKDNEDEFSARDGRALRADQRPRGLVRRVLRPGARRRAPLPPRPHQARRGHRRDASSRGPRSTRPPTSTAGCAPARSRPRACARVWVSPERARWAREERRVAEELADGSVVVELTFAGTDWLVREVLAKPATPPCSSPRTPGPPSPARSGGCAASPSAPAEGAAPLRGLARDRRLARRGGRARPEAGRRRRDRRPGRPRARAVPARLPPRRVRGLGHEHPGGDRDRRRVDPAPAARARRARAWSVDATAAGGVRSARPGRPAGRRPGGPGRRARLRRRVLAAHEPPARAPPRAARRRAGGRARRAHRVGRRPGAGRGAEPAALRAPCAGDPARPTVRFSAGDFGADLELDADGLVLDYPDLARRA